MSHSRLCIPARGPRLEYTSKYVEKSLKLSDNIFTVTTIKWVSYKQHISTLKASDLRARAFRLINLKSTMGLTDQDTDGLAYRTMSNPFGDSVILSQTP